MVIRRKNISRTKLSSNSAPSKTYLEDEEPEGFSESGAKLLDITNRLKKDVSALIAQINKLESTVECIENYVEEKTGVELGKEVTDSSDSDYESPDTIFLPMATISKKKHKYPGKRNNSSREANSPKRPG